jgi:hypothetical protein
MIATYILILGVPAVAILNYGAGPNLGSFLGRVDILQSYGLEQLAQGPILGRVDAELVSGPNLYLHSLLSIQTHLGFVGVALFCFAIGWSWFIIQSGSLRPVAWVIAPSILLVCLIGAFFTWYPLWVLIGLMVAAAYSSRPSRLVTHNATTFA